MAAPTFVSDAIAWWSSVYADHNAVSVTVRFLHLASLVLGGGTALAADRYLLAAVRGTPEDRRAALALAGASHRTVVPSVAVLAITGALMTASDLDTFLHSPLFWMKMTLVALLLINGALLVVAERAAAGGSPDRAWARMRLVSATSLGLWLLTLLAGTWLTVGA
jgi:uncharacterized membrane protein